VKALLVLDMNMGRKFLGDKNADIKRKEERREERRGEERREARRGWRVGGRGNVL